MQKTFYLHLIVIFIMLAALIPSPVSAQSMLAARLMLMRYFTAINFRDFDVAYSYWNSPPMSYSAFWGGYDNTSHVLPYFGEAQINSKVTRYLSARIPVIMIARQFGREVYAYYGCFTVSQQSGWHIDAANVAALPDDMLPDQKSMLAFLASDCENSVADAVFNIVPRRDQEPQGVVDSYYSTVNSKEFDYAYESWLNPKADYRYNRAATADYRPQYEQYVAALSDFKFTTVYFGPYFEIGSLPGKRYLEGMLPIVTIEQHFDGRFTASYGCVVIGRSLDDYLGIVNVKLLPLPLDPPGSIPDAQTIFHYTNIYCLGLELAY